jgi:hypothetical protein
LNAPNYTFTQIIYQFSSSRQLFLEFYAPIVTVNGEQGPTAPDKAPRLLSLQLPVSLQPMKYRKGFFGKQKEGIKTGQKGGNR